MTIDNLLDKKEISVGTYNVCFHNEIFSLEDICKVFQKHKTFKILRNCGPKKNNELIQVFEKYSSNIITEGSTIKENKAFSNTFAGVIDSSEIGSLFQEGRLSTRSYNVCKSNNLNSIKDLLQHYNKFSSFLNLENSGNKTNFELVAVALHEIRNNPNFSLPNEKDCCVEEIKDKISQECKDVAQNIILFELDLLPERSRKVISHFLNKKLSLENVEKVLLNNPITYSKIKKSLGLSLIGDVDQFITAFSNLLKDLRSSNDLQTARSLSNSYIAQKIFPDINFTTFNFSDFSILRLLHFVFSERKFESAIQEDIFKNFLRVFFNNNKISLENIGNNYNLSLGEVRKEIKLVVKDTLVKIKHLSFYYDIDMLKIILDEKQDGHLLITDSIMENINCQFNTSFSSDFLTYILSLNKEHSYKLVGAYEDVILKYNTNKNKLHIWKKLYLLDTQLANIFDWENFINDLKARSFVRSGEEFSLNFKSFLLKYIHNSNGQKLNETLPFAEKLVNVELEKFIDINNNIGFVKETTRLTYSAATVESVISAIKKVQNSFFESYNLDDLVPMVYKDIAVITGRDISAISRICERNFLLFEGRDVSYKFLFRDGTIKKTDGTRVTQITVLDIIKNMIENENKQKPLTDDKISLLLKEMGYIVARRTVAKFREEFLSIAKSNLRKSI
ncbi:hypothetical protein EGI11_03515 [Chryseobacterium sp. H3056]|uniref:RNA polymerase sigma factor 54 DNA-binding domain-containing protein n=1 Tax=Kaistella daneshvariae TaxID=2487074 RepID=A0A3N0WXN3_9FLAO|nr:hypothetical protein [Kaistella daneshvariae]ROI09837.1 hypothetical protein EGI11_03515 [Kaistella daneshvariae]